MRHSINSILLLSVLSVILVGGAHAQVFESDPTTDFELVKQNIAETGWSPVLIRLNLPNYEPEGQLTRSDDRIRQRASIADVQEQIVQQLVDGSADGNVRVMRRYDRLPYLALEVTDVGLEALKRNPFILMISANIAGQSAAEDPSPLESSFTEPAYPMSSTPAAPMSLPMDVSRVVVGADVANANGCDGSGWAIAIIDSGLDLNHAAFAGRVVSEACYSSNGTNQESLCPGGVTESTAAGSADDCRPCEYPGMPSTQCDFQPPSQLACPHGSLVAGAAVGNGSEGGVLIQGIAPEADIVSVKVFTRADTALSGCNGDVFKYGCAWVYASDLMKGIERVVELSETIDIAAINISVDMTITQGGPGALTGFSSPCDGEASLAGIKDAIELARSYGIPTIAATGNWNDPNRINPPACLTNTISVGYTEDGSFNPDAFSDNQSTLDAIGVDSNSDDFMDFWAPGEWITSAYPEKTTLTVRGSSVAAPQVAASFVALRSNGVGRGIDYYKGLLESTGVPVTDPRNGVTKPRIDVGAACLAMSSVEGDFRVLLEGPSIGGGVMAAGATLQDNLPLTQPFGDPLFAGTTIADNSIDAVTSIPANIVDWVQVELRSGTSAATTVAERPALLRTDGKIVDYDGLSPVRFVGVDSLSYYVVVRHRNHGDIMSKIPVSFATGMGGKNFRTDMDKAYSTSGNPMKQIDTNFAMFAGDINIDAQITAADFNLWLTQTKAGASGYVAGDINLDGQVTAADFNLWLSNTKAGLHSQVPD